MSKAKVDAPNGHSKLDDALATLIQNQAAFVSQHFDLERRHREIASRRSDLERRYVEIASQLERSHLEFASKHSDLERDHLETKTLMQEMRTQMAEIIRVLNEHTRLFQLLPEAVRDKIGFKQ